MVQVIFETIIWPVVIVTLHAVNQLSAFPTGGPSYSCRNLIPGHINGTQPDAPPYRIVVSRPLLEAGGRTSVSIESTSDFPFLGFICAVSDMFDQKNDTVGTMLLSPAFQQPDLIQTITCGRSTPDTAITHTSRQEKMKVDFDWMAPATASEGQRFKLRCSVVQSFYRCWTDIQQEITIVTNMVGGGQGGNRVVDIPPTPAGGGFRPEINPPRQSNSRNNSSDPMTPRNGNNNSVSQNGLLREIANNLVPLENTRITESNNDNNIFTTINDSPFGVLSSLGRTTNRENNRVQSGDNGFPNGNLDQNFNQNERISSLPTVPIRREEASRFPAQRINRPANERTINQIDNLPQPAANRPVSNSVPVPPPRSDVNGNPGGLSIFERALILELIRMGVDFFPNSGDRVQATLPRRGTNNQLRNIGNFQNSGQFSTTSADARFQGSRSNTGNRQNTGPNSGFQDAALVRSETRVFDPISRPQIRTRGTTRSNPNSRGLFQTRNTRTFDLNFSRIRRRNI